MCNSFTSTEVNIPVIKPTMAFEIGEALLDAASSAHHNNISHSVVLLNNNTMAVSMSTDSLDKGYKYQVLAVVSPPP